ncbi:hypothetical protein V5799_012449 [Amblyomma americanum]|uniref:C2H2-type domain-containing protein n=1 Tax=Amblyomma americanum TaxID=6943 RepID=A0AAQ4EEE7_AMBAM
MCFKRFAQTGHLNNHIRVHSGERPFGCYICGKTFVQSGHLTSHVRTHQGHSAGNSSGSCSVQKGATSSQRPAPHIIRLSPAPQVDLMESPPTLAEVTSPGESRKETGEEPADVRL